MLVFRCVEMLAVLCWFVFGGTVYHILGGVFACWRIQYGVSPYRVSLVMRERSYDYRVVRNMLECVCCMSSWGESTRCALCVVSYVHLILVVQLISVLFCE